MIGVESIVVTDLNRAGRSCPGVGIITTMDPVRRHQADAERMAPPPQALVRSGSNCVGVAPSLPLLK
jgi:hypothetical protein